MSAKTLLLNSERGSKIANVRSSTIKHTINAIPTVWLCIFRSRVFEEFCRGGHLELEPLRLLQNPRRHILISASYPVSPNPLLCRQIHLPTLPACRPACFYPGVLLDF